MLSSTLWGGVRGTLLTFSGSGPMGESGRAAPRFWVAMGGEQELSAELFRLGQFWECAEGRTGAAQITFRTKGKESIMFLHLPG